MDFIRRFIEQKISVATGEQVRMGGLSFSPLSGVVEVRELAVGTFLTVNRIEAKIAVGRALKQEIVVRSLAIEGPVFTINRAVDGKLNLPPRPPRTRGADSKEMKTGWEFEAQKVLLVGGRIQFTDASGYQLSLQNLVGSVEMKSPKEAEFLFAADSFGRRDQPVELGEARLIGKLAQGLSVTLTAGNLLDLNLSTPAIDAGQWTGELQMKMLIPTLLALLPPSVRLPIATATGEAKLSAVGTFDGSASAFTLQQFELRAGPVTIR